MTSQRLKILQRFSLLSPVMMWFGMLLACFAWMMHIAPLLTPLWSDNASLGHGICIELAPVISAAQHHEQVTADLRQAPQHGEHHSTAPASIFYDNTASHSNYATVTATSAATDQPMIIASTTQSLATDKTTHFNPTAKHHNSCDICTAMSASILPTDIVQTNYILIELVSITETMWSPFNTHHSNAFLRPFPRAPPPTLFV